MRGLNIITIEHVHVDFLGLGVGRITLVQSGIRWPRILNQQEGRRCVSLHRDNGYAAPRRIVIYYLQSVYRKHRIHIAGVKSWIGVPGSSVEWMAAHNSEMEN